MRYSHLAPVCGFTIHSTVRPGQACVDEALAEKRPLALELAFEAPLQTVPRVTLISLIARLRAGNLEIVSRRLDLKRLVTNLDHEALLILLFVAMAPRRRRDGDVLAHLRLAWSAIDVYNKAQRGSEPRLTISGTS